MVIIITGATHTGKTVLAQRLLEKYKYPYFSMDHLKMGLIRSKNISLTPLDDEKLMPYLWGIIKEIIKTAIENQQNLIIEGGYIPFNWAGDFSTEYLKNIDYYCLVMTPEYIKKHFTEILKYANVIEKRKNNLEYSVEQLIAENDYNLAMCKKFGNKFILIEDDYKILIQVLKNKGENTWFYMQGWMWVLPQ